MPCILNLCLTPPCFTYLLETQMLHSPLPVLLIPPAVVKGWNCYLNYNSRAKTTQNSTNSRPRRNDRGGTPIPVALHVQLSGQLLKNKCNLVSTHSAAGLTHFTLPNLTKTSPTISSLHGSYSDSSHSGLVQCQFKFNSSVAHNRVAPRRATS